MNKHNVLGVIAARKGSKRLPGKNTKLLNGRPLITYTIKTALLSKKISDILVYTNDEQILKIAEGYGIKGMKEPDYLAEDHIIPEVAIKYLLRQLDEIYDAVVLLQPTSPLRTCEDIDNCIEMFFDGNFDSVVSVVQFKKMYTFMPNGAVFVMKNYTKWTNNMGLYVMPQDRSIDIDLEEDFELAEILMKKNVKKT